MDAITNVDLDTTGGTVVFAKTRVPIETLLDYLEAGDTLACFLDDFPTVKHDQAVALSNLRTSA